MGGRHAKEDGRKKRKRKTSEVVETPTPMPRVPASSPLIRGPSNPAQMPRGPVTPSQMTCSPHNAVHMTRLPSPAQMVCGTPTPTQMLRGAPPPTQMAAQFNPQQQQQQPPQQQQQQQHPHAFQQQQNWGMMGGMPGMVGGSGYSARPGVMTTPQGCNHHYPQQHCPTSHTCCDIHNHFPVNMPPNMNAMGGPNIAPTIGPAMRPTLAPGFGEMVRPNMCRSGDPSMFRGGRPQGQSPLQQQSQPQLQQQPQQMQQQPPHQMHQQLTQQMQQHSQQQQHQPQNQSVQHHSQQQQEQHQPQQQHHQLHQQQQHQSQPLQHQLQLPLQQHQHQLQQQHPQQQSQQQHLQTQQKGQLQQQQQQQQQQLQQQQQQQMQQQQQQLQQQQQQTAPPPPPPPPPPPSTNMMGPGSHIMAGMRGAGPHPSTYMNNMMCRMPGSGMMPPRVLPPGTMPTPQSSNEQPSVPAAFWEEGEKRRKTGGRPKKRFKGAVERSPPCPNVDVRNLHNDHSGPAMSGQGGPGPPASGPSFMDDPSGYLAQQTALLNNTMTGGGMGQFSPQAPGISPRPPPPSQSVPQSVATGVMSQHQQQQQLAPQSQTGTITVVNNNIARAAQISSSPAVVPLPSNVPLPARVSKAATQTTNTVITTPSVLPTQSSHTSAGKTPNLTFTAPLTNSATPMPHHQNSIANEIQIISSFTKDKNGNRLENSNDLLYQNNDGEVPNINTSSVAKVESSGLVHTTTVTYTISSTPTTNTKVTSSMPSTTLGGCLHQRERESVMCYKTEDDQPHKIKCESSTPLESLKSPVSVSSVRESMKVESCYKDVGNGKQCESEESSPEQFPSGGPGSINEGISPNKPLTPGPPGVNTGVLVTQSPLEMVQSIVSSIPVPSSLGPLRPSSQQQPTPQVPPPMPPQPHHQQQQLQQQQTAAVPLSLSPGMYNGPISTSVTVYGGGGSGGLVRASGPLLVSGPSPAHSGVFVTSSGGCNGPTNMVVVSSPFNTKGNGATGVAVTSGVAGVVGVQAAMPQVQVQQQMTPMQQHLQSQLQPQLQQQLQPQLQQQLQSQLQPHLQPQLQQFQPVQPVVQLVNTFATMQTPVIIQNGGNIIQSSTGLLPSPGGMLTGPSPLTQGTIMTGQSLVPATATTLTVEGTHHHHHHHHHHHQQQTQVGQPQSSPHVQVAQVVTTGLTGESLEDVRTRNTSTPLGTSGSTSSTPHSTPGSTPGSDTASSGGSSGGRRRKRRRNTSTPQGSSTSQSSPLQQQQGLVPAIIMGNKVPQHMVMNGPHMTQVSPYGAMGTMTAAGQMAQVATVTSQVGGGQVLQAATAPGTGAINVVQMVGNTLPNLPVQVHNPPAIVVGSAPSQGVVINQLADGTFISTDPNTGMSYPVQLQLSGGHIVGVTPAVSAAGGMVGSLTSGPTAGGMPAMVAVRPPVPQTVVSGAKVVNISPSAATAQLTGGAGVHVLPVTASYQAPGTTVSPGQAVCMSQGTTPSVVVTSEYVNGQPVVISGNGCSSNTTVVQHKTTIVQQRTTLVATQSGDESGTHSSVSTQTPGGLGESDVSSSDCVSTAAPSSPSHQSAEVTTTRHDEDATPPTDPSPPLPPHSLDKNKHIIPEEPHSASTSEEAVTCGRGVVWGPHRGHHYWPAQVLHQVGGECVVQWYGDHRVDTVKYSVLSTFPIVPPKVPTRRSVRGRNALDKAIAEAVQDNTTHCQDYQAPQPRRNKTYADSPTTLNIAVDGPLNGLGSGPKNRSISRQAKPTLKRQHSNEAQVKQVMSGEAKKRLTSKTKCLTLTTAFLVQESSSSLPPQHLLPAPCSAAVTPARNRSRRRIR